MRLSTLSNRLSITPILSFTFAPPIIAVNGRSGFPKAPPNTSSSFSIKKPATAGMWCAIPSVEACARCAAPNASFT